MDVSANAEANESTSNTLLQRVQRQDPQAWQRFAALYGPVVYRWNLKYGVRAQDAADVTQDVFHAVFVNIGRFRRESAGDSLRGWLWTIARNKICDHFRRCQNQPIAPGGLDGQQRLNEIPDVPEINAESASSETAELSHRALLLIQTEFESTTWQAFWAMAIEGMPAADAAHSLGISVAAAYKAKSRVLNRLRQDLEGLLE